MRTILLAAALALSAAPALARPLPENWLGTWVGEMASHRPGVHDPTMTFRAELRITPMLTVGRYGFMLIYGEGEARQVRDYVLIESPDKPGHFVIDEQNSIILDTTLVHGALYSRFSAVGQEILAVNRLLNDDEMLYELITWTQADGRDSGGQGDVFAVRSWPVTAAQRGVLRRQPDPAPAPDPAP